MRGIGNGRVAGRTVCVAVSAQDSAGSVGADSVIWLTQGGAKEDSACYG